jgi:CubicO group peptidase (beta-lactamase class C family)
MIQMSDTSPMAADEAPPRPSEQHPGAAAAGGAQSPPSETLRQPGASFGNTVLHGDSFLEEIHGRISGSVVGYAMQLRRNGVPLYFRVWNWARRPIDGDVGFTLNRRMHIGSISKFLTAIAMLRVLDAKQLSPDTPIVAYLPKYWGNPGPYGNTITFRHLLTHTSGFDTGPQGGLLSNFATLKSVFRAGVKPGSVGVQNYQNVNFGFMRILVPVVNGDVDVLLAPASGADAYWDSLTITCYRDYMQANVLKPSGVTNAALVSSPDCALGYRYADSGHGLDSGDLASTSGEQGWHMSVPQLLDVVSTFRRTSKIMAPDRSKTLLESQFGVTQMDKGSGNTIWVKNGYSTDGLGRTHQGVLLMGKDGYDVAVLANSNLGTSADVGQLSRIVTDAYGNNLFPS